MIPENNQDSIAAIKGRLFTLLVAMVVISGTLTGYLYTQASMANKELTAAKQIATQLNQSEVAMNNFVGKLAAYGEKHPDFASSVLKKYGITMMPGTAPAPSAAPKK
jgi:hypothetical protein